MSDKDFTPREFAYALAMDVLHDTWRGYINQERMEVLPPARRKKVRDQIAKLHNKLGEMSKVDYLILGDPL